MHQWKAKKGRRCIQWVPKIPRLQVTKNKRFLCALSYLCNDKKKKRESERAIHGLSCLLLLMSPKRCWNSLQNTSIRWWGKEVKDLLAAFCLQVCRDQVTGLTLSSENEMVITRKRKMSHMHYSNVYKITCKWLVECHLASCNDKQWPLSERPPELQEHDFQSHRNTTVYLTDL